MLSWALLIATGWALVYWSFLPGAFHFSTRMLGGFHEALYLSFVNLATLGYGDIVPVRPFIRLAATTEALTGFALLTAAVSWVLSTYPVVGRQRRLAAEISATNLATERAGGWEALPSEHQVACLRSLTSQLLRVQTDLSQFPVTYHFHPGVRAESLPAVAPIIVDWIAASKRSSDSVVRAAADIAAIALDQFAAEVRKQFLPHAPASADGTLAAYAADHRQ
jgi:hypothetical protein